MSSEIGKTEFCCSIPPKGATPRPATRGDSEPGISWESTLMCLPLDVNCTGAFN